MSTESEHLGVVHTSRRRICSYHGKRDLCVPLPQFSKISSPVFKVLESTLLDRRTLILISTKNEKWKLRFYFKMDFVNSKIEPNDAETKMLFQNNWKFTDEMWNK